MSKPAVAGYFANGVHLARLGRWKEAAEAYQMAFQDDPRNADALINLGFVYYELGLDEQAQDAFSAAQRLRESNEKCDSNEF